MAQPFARDRVVRLAKVDTEAALDAARRISEPWYKCQALAGVARYAANDSLAVRVAEEASRTVEDEANPYHAVAAVAWPVRALLERAHIREAEAMMRRAGSGRNKLPTQSAAWMPYSCSLKLAGLQMAMRGPPPSAT
jgi:hypothetical protein